MIRIDPERLRQVRGIRRLTRDELAAEAAPLNAKTIYRLERGKRPIRPATLDRLARALKVDPAVLTGEVPIPVEMGQAPAPRDEASYQLNVRVQPAVRNAYELAARRYGVSVQKIAQLAPLFFVVLAEASLKNRRKHVQECWTKYEEYCDAKSKIPCPIPVYELGQEIREEKYSIRDKDIFGENLSDYSENPFESYMQALGERYGDGEVTVNSIGPTSTDYVVCRSEAVALAGEECADWLLRGEVPIHRVPRGLEREKRIEWIRDPENRISARKIEEEDPEERILPAPIAGLVLDLDFDL
jgi:transcriptional regulator with XRE-family HTH domain